jgi:hypothetical protein
MCSAKLLGWSILLIHGNFMEQLRENELSQPKKLAINAPANRWNCWTAIVTIASRNCFASSQLNYDS